MKLPWLSPKNRRHNSFFRHVAHFENVLGTSLEIQVIGEQIESGPRAETAILGEIDRLELIFNAYNPQSELSRWQRSFGEEIAVSSELAQVLASAQSWKERTSGAFNPAVEAFTRLWKGFEAKNEIAARELEALLAQMDGPLWSVDLERRTATRRTNLPVTLNSIAKGFIIDRAAEMGASVEGVRQVLVNIGGDIRHIGIAQVTVSVADPRADAENAIPSCQISLSNQGIATSGDYRRGFQVGNRWFSHLFDPRTGFPVEVAIGVSVVAPDALSADVLATTFSVLSPADSVAFADSLESVGVFWISPNGAHGSNDFWRLQREKRREDATVLNENW